MLLTCWIWCFISHCQIRDNKHDPWLYVEMHNCTLKNDVNLLDMIFVHFITGLGIVLLFKLSDRLNLDNWLWLNVKCMLYLVNNIDFDTSWYLRNWWFNYVNHYCYIAMGGRTSITGYCYTMIEQGCKSSGMDAMVSCWCSACTTKCGDRCMMIFLEAEPQLLIMWNVIYIYCLGYTYD